MKMKLRILIGLMMRRVATGSGMTRTRGGRLRLRMSIMRGGGGGVLEEEECQVVDGRWEVSLACGLVYCGILAAWCLSVCSKVFFL